MFYWFHFQKTNKCFILVQRRSTPSTLAKSCKIQKVAYFTHFEKKKKKTTSVSVKLCINAQIL